MKKLLSVLLPLVFGGCLDVPEGVKPVEGFELDRYLGKWYEIARLDHSFERGLQGVSAEYALRDDGGVTVTNRGYSVSQEKWKEAQGKVFFVDKPDVGHLKVSFFGPFFGTYAVYELDEDYQYAFISGSTTKYLWFLSRTPQVSEDLKAEFIDKAKSLGFDVDNLIFVNHN